MRLWTIHPKYLDPKGLVAVWREALLAKKVLEGMTKGYTHHPELNRFKETKDPVGYINAYLAGVYKESCARGYCFDKAKIGKAARGKMKTVRAQLIWEFDHLKSKLKKRDPVRFKELGKVTTPEPHPLFIE